MKHASRWESVGFHLGINRMGDFFKTDSTVLCRATLV